MSIESFHGALQALRPVFRLAWSNHRKSQTRRVTTVSNPPIASSTGETDGQSPSLSLRPYQQECLNAILEGFKAGHQRLGVSLATGSGKTDPLKFQTLILAHRRELVEQAAKHCRRAYPDQTVELEMGNAHASGSANITVASIASITSGNRIDKFDPASFKLILVDEAHHIVAPTFMKVLEYFRLTKSTLHELSPALVGVSATLARTDGVRLSDALDYIVYHKDYLDMIDEKWLSSVRFTTVKTNADLRRVKSSTFGDFQLKQLSEAVNTDETNDIIFRAWSEKASERKSTLGFCIDLQHVAALTKTFRQNGIDAQYVTSYTDKNIRQQRLDDFRAGKIPVLLNCGIYTEGTDIPNIDCVLLARPTKSRNLLIQMIGRGMRLHEDKQDCHVLDLVSSLKTGVVTTPSLFGLDPDSLVKDASAEDLKTKKEQEVKREAEVQNVPKCTTGSRSMTFVDYDNVFDLIQETSGERHIRSFSPNAWVLVSPNRYVLSGKDGSWLTIKIEDGRDDSHVVTLTQRLWRSSKEKAPFRRPREIASSMEFERAVRAADEYARHNMSNHVTAGNARWRRDPATDGQLNMLNKYRHVDDHLGPADVTKGRAADMITKIKFGAQGQYAEAEARKRRERRATERKQRTESIRQNSIATVGPLHED